MIVDVNFYMFEHLSTKAQAIALLQDSDINKQLYDENGYIIPHWYITGETYVTDKGTKYYVLERRCCHGRCCK